MWICPERHRAGTNHANKFTEATFSQWAESLTPTRQTKFINKTLMSNEVIKSIITSLCNTGVLEQSEYRFIVCIWFAFASELLMGNKWVTDKSIVDTQWELCMLEYSKYSTCDFCIWPHDQKQSILAILRVQGVKIPLARRPMGTEESQSGGIWM